VNSELEGYFGYDEKIPSSIRPIFVWLCQDVLSIVIKWNFYLCLFGNEENAGLLSDTALGSFRIIEESLRHDLTMSICRLGDPSRDKRGYCNLSFQTLRELVKHDSIDGLSKLVDEFLEAHKPVKKYRHKQIGHSDLNVRIKPQENFLPDIGRTQIDRIVKLSCQILQKVNQHYTSSEIMFLPKLLGGAEDLVYWLNRGWESEQVGHRRW